jgi:hypothetical protein
LLPVFSHCGDGTNISKLPLSIEFRRPFLVIDIGSAGGQKIPQALSSESQPPKNRQEPHQSGERLRIQGPTENAGGCVDAKLRCKIIFSAKLPGYDYSLGSRGPAFFQASRRRSAI